MSELRRGQEHVRVEVLRVRGAEQELLEVLLRLGVKVLQVREVVQRLLEAHRHC